ncbi:CCA tRNA nucleotidyltransferase [bacterium]|nr:CCA tRNA nucleotidyltransferase [bacterium]
MDGEEGVMNLPNPLKRIAAFLASQGEAWVVGGWVRDTAMGLHATDLDILLLDGAKEKGEALFSEGVLDREDWTFQFHPRFQTVSLENPPYSVGLSTRRKEAYPQQGKLPKVFFPATWEEDFSRRDFTLNALIARIDNGGDLGDVEGPDQAKEDLAATRWRVFHRESFVDDPTRLFRLMRYRFRLGGDLAPETIQAMENPRLGDAFCQVAPERWRHEIVRWVESGGPPLWGEGEEGKLLQTLFGGRWSKGVMGSVEGFLAGCRGGEAPSVWVRMGSRKKERKAMAPLAEEGFPFIEEGFSLADVDKVARSWTGVVRVLASRESPQGLVEEWEGIESHLEMPSGVDLLPFKGVPSGKGVGRWLEAGRDAVFRGACQPDKESILGWIETALEKSRGCDK